MKKFSEELRYDGATIEQVHAMLTDRAFREKVCDYQHVLRTTVQITSDGAGTTVEMDQVQAARGIPGFAKKLVGEEINIVQTEDWSRPDKGDIVVVIPGKPGEITGTALLAEDAGGTTETIDFEVRISIPLVGGKIEGLVADLLSKAWRAEHKVGLRWLADQH